jgi:hypothetical protein
MWALVVVPAFSVAAVAIGVAVFLLARRDPEKFKQRVDEYERGTASLPRAFGRAFGGWDAPSRRDDER